MAPIETTKDLSSLSPNQQKALNALLSTTSIPAAAEECGLGTSTIKRYLSEDKFSAVYREQRRLILETTIASLQSLGSKAVEAFEGALECGDTNTELRAASAVLGHVEKLTELERRVREQEELERRMSVIEETLRLKQNGGYKLGA